MRQPKDIRIGDRTLADVLDDHARWLRRERGQRANLSFTDLSHADLYKADLRGVLLRFSILRFVDLSEADLSFADLRQADLCHADLRHADLGGAILPHFQLPDGDLIGWKKVSSELVRLRIPYRARRTACLVNRDCRAEFAVVDWIDGGAQEVTSSYGGIYRVGEEVWPDRYCDDFRTGCSHGIHFFQTRAEAEEWNDVL